MSKAPAGTGSCAFCEIVSGNTRSNIVFEDEHSLAFLDNRPLFPGHSLLVPREHHETPHFRGGED